MKRWAMRICVLLVLGAIVNVAVAWTLAVARRTLSGNERIAAASATYGTWQTSSSSRVGEDMILSQRLRTGSNTRIDSEIHPSETIPSWAPFRDPSREFAEATLPVMEHRLAIARGFPMLSLWSERGHVFDLKQYQTMSTVVPPLFGGIETRLRWPVNAPVNWPLDLPLRPIWPGFAINTVFYAVILWLLFAAPFALRRWRRIRRGLCPNCGYDLRKRPSDSSVCPECGATVRA